MKVQKYLLMEEIGSGSFSTVYKALDTETNELYAIKSMREMTRNNEEVIKNEIELLKRVSHKNIMGFVTDFNEKGKWYLVFEYCGKGDLRKFKDKQGRLPEIFCKNIAYSVVSALSILHADNIVHRDLKLQNILINDNYDFKLADFGFSKDNESELMVSFCGTPSAMAPQILKREPYDDRCDTWSLGVMLYEMIYGKLPFLPNKKYGAGIFGLTNCVLESEPVYDKTIQISEECLHFIKLCLKKDKNERPRVVDLVRHEWISNVVSKIGKDMLKDILEDKSEIKNKVKEIFHGAVNEHIQKLIIKYRLIETEIRKYMIIFDKFYPSQKQTKTHIIFMFLKLLKQLYDQKILIQFNKSSEFTLDLKEIKSFQVHIDKIRKFLKSQIPGVQMPNNNIVIENEIVSFFCKEAPTVLRIVENIPEKRDLITYLSLLPLKQPLHSVIEIFYASKKNSAKTEQMIHKEVQSLNQKQLIKYVNEHYHDEELSSYCLFDHSFDNKQREGEIIKVGEIINQVISINNEMNNEEE